MICTLIASSPSVAASALRRISLQFANKRILWPPEFRGQIGRTIRFAIQDEAPVVPTLGQVVWHINGNYPSEASHSKETISANRLYVAASRKDELQLILDWPIRSAGFTHSAGSET
jgi:hypothetical protein